MNDSIQLYTANDMNSLPSASFIYPLDAYGAQVQMSAMQNLGMEYDPHYSIFLAAPNIEPQRVKNKFTLRSLGATDGMTLYVLLTDPSNSKPLSSVPQNPRPLPAAATQLPRLNTSQSNKNANMGRPPIGNIPTPLILQNKGKAMNILGRPAQPAGILGNSYQNNYQNNPSNIYAQRVAQSQNVYAPNNFPPLNGNNYNPDSNSANPSRAGYPVPKPRPSGNNYTQNNNYPNNYSNNGSNNYSNNGPNNFSNIHQGNNYSNNERGATLNNRAAFLDDNDLPPEIEPYFFQEHEFEILTTQGSISVAKERSTGIKYAIKRLKGKIRTEQFNKEFVNIMNAEAGGILHIEGFISKPSYSIILDYSPIGSLEDILDSERIMNAPDEWNATAKMIALFGIAEGMRQLHSRRIMHRNLKPSNVILDENFYPRIGDVGFTREYNRNPSYMAPEMLSGGSYKSKVDIFAYGMIVYQTVAGKPPFDPSISFHQIKEMIMAGKRPEIPSNVPGNYSHLIQQCWNQEPSLRPTFAFIVEAFVNGNYQYPGADNDAVLEFQRTIAPQFEPEFAKVVQLQKNAQYGDTGSQFELALCFIRGKGVNKNMKEGIRCLKASADKGNDKAQFVYARYLLRFEKDEDGAKEYLKKSAQNGNNNSQCLLDYLKNPKAQPPPPQPPSYLQVPENAVTTPARSSKPEISLYEKSKSLEKTDPEKSKKFLKMAADQGDEKAQLHYALSLHNGLKGIQKDIVEANKYYKLAADQGNPRAQCNLAFNMQRGEGIGKNIKIANDLYLKSAEQGYAVAQYNYAYNLLNGIGVQKNLEEANKFYKLAADQGHAGAQFSYASNLMNGTGIEKNVAMANEYFKMSAEKGNALAQCQLAMNYANGTGVEKDLSEAARLYKLSADQGNSRAQCNYAFSLQKGSGVPQDLVEANKYYKLSADQNYAIAQYNYAFNLENGNGVEKNQAEANKYYKMAADLGNANAQYNHAMNLIKGNGMPKDMISANKYLKLAVEQKNPRAQYQYALHLQKGTCVDKDPKYANELLKASADQGNTSAQFYYGYNLFNGNGIEKNPEEANKYYKMAADQGNSNSQCNLACSYLNGIGLPKNIELANKYYKLSADSGNAVAQYNYGIHLMNGNGVPKNIVKAVEYLKKSAEQKNGSAMYCLSLCYENGNGIEKNDALADKYLKMSAEVGNKLAIQHLNAKKH